MVVPFWINTEMYFYVFLCINRFSSHYSSSKYGNITFYNSNDYYGRIYKLLVIIIYIIHQYTTISTYIQNTIQQRTHTLAGVTLIAQAEAAAVLMLVMQTPSTICSRMRGMTMRKK